MAGKLPPLSKGKEMEMHLWGMHSLGYWCDTGVVVRGQEPPAEVRVLGFDGYIQQAHFQSLFQIQLFH